MSKAILVLAAGLSLSGAYAFADLFDPISQVVFGFGGMGLGSALSPGTEDCWGQQEHFQAQVRNRLLGRTLTNVRGEGTLRVLGDGTILIAVESLVPNRDGSPSFRVVRMVPSEAGSTSMLPDAKGMIEVAYSAGAKTAVVEVDGEPFVRFSLRQGLDAGRGGSDSAAPIVSGVELAAERLSAEAIGELSILLIEAVLDGRLPVESLAAVTDWRAAYFELGPLWYAGDNRCRDCTAGGEGSTGGGVGGCPGGNPDDCEVNCGEGYYACCHCRGGSNGTSASCACCPIKQGALE